MSIWLVLTRYPLCEHLARAYPLPALRAFGSCLPALQAFGSCLPATRFASIWLVLTRVARVLQGPSDCRFLHQAVGCGKVYWISEEFDALRMCCEHLARVYPLPALRHLARAHGWYCIVEQLCPLHGGVVKCTVFGASGHNCTVRCFR